MVKQRDSIRALGEQLSELVISGGANSAKAIDLATRLNKLCREGGVYQKRYASNEERVLHRHMNLYKNKRNKAQTSVERARWDGKIVEQRAKIAAFEAGVPEGDVDDLDLDGL